MCLCYLRIIISPNPNDDALLQMSLRAFDHLLHYGELPIRRAVPIAMAMLNVRLA